MEKAYKAVIVAYTEDGIFFAKRSDSPEQSRSIVFDDILRVLDDNLDDFGNASVTLTSRLDGYGESVVTVKGRSGEINYQVCRDDEREEEGDEKS